MNKTERAPYLEAADGILGPLGFTRKKRDQEWRRLVDDVNVEWVHLNFGLAVINPSFGVFYQDLDALCGEMNHSSWGTMVMLSRITGRSYTSADSPQDLASDLAKAIPELLLLRDRSSVIKRLEANEPQHWPVVLRSFRIRLLPLLLAGCGRIREANEWIARFEPVAQQSDQVVPGFGEFVANLRRRLNA